MITLEQLEKALEDKEPFQDKGIDHNVVAINLLRNRIPFDVCREIVCGAEHDILYFCDIDFVLKYLNEEDLTVLGECNVMYNEDNGCLAMFV